jgi:DNA-binding response OmpR family regulator
MAATILVVEDQPAMQRNIRKRLEASGYNVETAADGVEALDVLAGMPVDLILADVAMPRMNGYQLYEELRRNPQWALMPFIFVSARNLDSDVRFGKALGVDDYLVKPFQFEDLLAIVAGRLRRAAELAQVVGTRPGSDDILTAGVLRISASQHRVWVNDEPVSLSPHEFAFIEYLVRRAGQAVSLTELCQATHGIETDSIEAGNLLYPLVSSLRRRLGQVAGDKGPIESVRGIGYRLAV